jgi:hypothetical protein
MRADFAELRQEMHAEFARVRQEMSEGLGIARRETSEVRQEVRVGLANLEKTMAQRHSEFLRWMVGFWLLSLVTLVGSVVALARILA